MVFSCLFSLLLLLIACFEVLLKHTCCTFFSGQSLPWLPKTMWRKQRVLDWFAVLTVIWTAKLLQAHHGNGPESPLAQNRSVQHGSTLAFGGWLRDASRLLWLNKLVFATCGLRMWSQLTVQSFLIIGYWCCCWPISSLSCFPLSLSPQNLPFFDLGYIHAFAGHIPLKP